MSVGGMDMSKIKLIIGTSILLLLSVAMPVNSAVIYDESLSGEFDGFGNPGPVNNSV